MNDRLFVYGTLRQDVANSKFRRLLGGDARLVARGRMKGRLFDLGRYPGFVISPQDSDGSWVQGEVYALGNPRETLARLDDYEGCGIDDPPPHPYERVERDVVLDDGGRVSAWVYVYKRAVDPTGEIRSGDYGGTE
jgi:gamma-glutamylcyclotransferase (GGCT)/AIG2-like uncharacterized protein YtfP